MIHNRSLLTLDSVNDINSLLVPQIRPLVTDYLRVRNANIEFNWISGDWSSYYMQLPLPSWQLGPSVAVILSFAQSPTECHKTTNRKMLHEYTLAITGHKHASIIN